MSNEERTQYTWADIEAANSTIKTTPIKGKDYAEVPQRIKAFRKVCPHGAIITEMLSNENGVCVFRATIYDENHDIIGTGTAFENEKSSFINKTSYIENCETSAVGRALGMCGFGIDTSVASYEEVATAVANQNTEETPKQKEKTPRERLIARLKEKGINVAEYAKEKGLSGNVPDSRFEELLAELG